MAKNESHATTTKYLSRLESYKQLIAEGTTQTRVLAQRLGVSERSVYRYGHQLAGCVDRRLPKQRYQQIKPKVLAHLQAYPNSRFSAWDLVKVLGLDTTQNNNSAVGTALRHLQREGLAQSIVEPRDSSTRQLVTRWQLAETQVTVR